MEETKQETKQETQPEAEQEAKSKDTKFWVALCRVPQLGTVRFRRLEQTLWRIGERLARFIQRIEGSRT